MRYYPIVLISLIVWSVKLLAANSPFAIADAFEVARIFDYPRSKLIESDITDSIRVKYGDKVLSAYEYTSSDNTFARLTIVVTLPGVLLNEGRLARIAEALKGDDSLHSRKEDIRRIKLGTEMEGFVGLSGFGPGGEIWRAVAAVPQKGIEVQISVTVPYDPPLEERPESASYHKLVREGGDHWLDRLSRVLQFGVKHVLSKKDSLLSSSEGAIQDVATDDPAKEHGNRGAFAQAHSTAPAGQSLPLSRSSGNWLIFAGIVIAALFAGAVAWKILRR